MPANDKEERELWVGWAQDGVAQYVVPEDDQDLDDQIEDMVDVATGYADAMLEEFRKRFEGGSARQRKGPKRRNRSRDESKD